MTWNASVGFAGYSCMNRSGSFSSMILSRRQYICPASRLYACWYSSSSSSNAKPSGGVALYELSDEGILTELDRRDTGSGANWVRFA